MAAALLVLQATVCWVDEPRRPAIDATLMVRPLRSQTEAMCALAYLIASARDMAAGHPDAEVRRERQAFGELMAPVFKGWATETAIEVTSMSSQIHGGLGYIEENAVPQPLRDVPGWRKCMRP